MYYYGTYQGNLNIFPEEYPLWVMGEDIHSKLESIRFYVQRKTFDNYFTKINVFPKEKNEMTLLMYNLTIKNITEEEVKDAFLQKSLMETLQAMMLSILVLKNLLYHEKITVGVLICDLIYIPGTPEILIKSFEKSLQKKNKTLTIPKLLSAEFGYSSRKKMITHYEKQILKTDSFPNKYMVISAEHVLPKFNNIFITSETEDVRTLIQYLESLTLQELKTNYKDFYQEITKFDDDTLNKHFENKSEEWAAWSNCFLMFVLLNNVLLNKPIPIVR